MADTALRGLVERIGADHVVRRLGIEAAHEKQLFGQGTLLFNVENWKRAPWVVEPALNLPALHGGARRNPDRVEVRRNLVTSTRLPAAFDVFTNLHLSDHHADISQGAMRHLADIVRYIACDICVLSGDYRGKSFGSFETSLALMGWRSVPGENYWLAVIDIDHFKSINDRFGHMVGDETLLLVSRLMSQTFLGSDLLYRYGGEEFVAIIAADNAKIAHNVFERVRLAIEAHILPQIEHLTISIGYCQAMQDILPVEVLSRADRSLYQAKQDGRNRVYSYHHLLASGVFKEQVCVEAEFF